MRLKVVTAGFILVILLLVLGSPALFRLAPSHTAPRDLRRAYAVQTLSYFGLLMVAFIGAGAGSFLVYRQARKEYEEESIQNLKSLLEAPVKSDEESDDGE